MNTILKTPQPSVEKPRGLRILAGTQSCCRVVVALRNPNAVALAEDRGIVHIYDYYGQRLSFIKAHKDRINGLVEIAPYTLVTVGNDGFVRVWDLAKAQGTKSQLLFQVKIPGNVVASALYAPSPDRLVVGTLYGNILLYAWNDRKLHRLEEINRAHQSRINSIHGHADLLVTASNDDSVSLWSIKENKLQLIKNISLKQPVYSVAVSVNFVAIGMKGALLICKNEHPNYTVRSIVPVPFGVVWCLKWAHNEKLLISGDSILTFFDPHLSTIVKRVQTDAILVIAADFLSRSTLVVTGKGKFSSAIVWLNNAKEDYTETPYDHVAMEEHNAMRLEDASGFQYKNLRCDDNTRSMPNNARLIDGTRSQYDPISPHDPANAEQHSSEKKISKSDEINEGGYERADKKPEGDEPRGRNKIIIPEEAKEDHASNTSNFEKLSISTTSNGNNNNPGSGKFESRMSDSSIHHTECNTENRTEKNNSGEERVEKPPTPQLKAQTEENLNDKRKRERSLVGSEAQRIETSNEKPDLLEQSQGQSDFKRARKVEQGTISKLLQWKGFGLSRSDFQDLDQEKIAEAMAAFMIRYKPNWGNKFKPLSSCLYNFFDSNMLTADDLFGIHAIEANELTSKIKLAMDEDKSVGNAMGLRNGVKRFFASFDTSSKN